VLQSLRGLKLPRRLLTALYRRTIALLLHCVKHPIKTVFFIIKAYLLLMLFAFFLAFSVGSFAQETPPVQCELGETYLPGYGCGIVALEQSCKLQTIRWDRTGTGYGSGFYNNSSARSLSSYLTGYDQQFNRYCSKGLTRISPESVINTHDLDPGSCPTDGSLSKDVDFTITRTTNQYQSYGTQTTPMVCQYSDAPIITEEQTVTATITFELSDEIECTDSHPIGPIAGPAPYELNQWCYRIPEPEPCDCSDLTGFNPQGINYFYATPGAYSQASPPNCINRDDNENSDVPSCNCKLIATKWVSADVNINGTQYTRWQPVPDQSGITGVFTGGQCDESEKDTPPDEPEECYNLGNGQRFCLEDPNKKCAKIDGIMTCQAGCGTVNGEFFCFEDEPPEEEIPDPNDDITDPDKPLNNMIKQDFKDVLGGTEQRLDILAKLLSQIKTDTGKGDGAMASKQDATNRLLKEISDKLDGEDGDNETPTNPQPTYNTDKLEDFVNPNDWGEKNFRTVGTAFKDRLMEAPVMQAVNGFFDVALSGSCPTWQTTVSMPFGGSFAINIDQLCSETMNNIWPAIRAIIVLIFTFLAFRVAFTNE
jgi:hypothetical protein